ncbi:MAG: hypothetical protein DI539_30290 [Flavobacterium psychrophilum]|nr:MAG: hypothetical protein DI539_30290 [Flavobacterium psychrophilum]
MGAVGMKTSRCTPEELRRYDGFGNYNDEEAERVIDSVERLAHILLLVVKENSQSNEQSINSSKLRKGTEDG